MLQRPLAMIIGSSLLMDCVAESLDEIHMPGVVRLDIDTETEDVMPSVRRMSPDMIVFELSATGSSDLVEVLHEMPGARLIGLDSGCGRLVVMSSRECCIRSMSDLQTVLEAEAGIGRGAL